MLFFAMLEITGGGAGMGFFLRLRPSFNSSVIFLATSLLIVSARDGGDGMAGTWGGDVTCRWPSVRMIAGAKITDTMASAKVSAMNNPTIIKIARTTGESPLRAPFDKARTLPRNFPSRDGGVGLPIVSA